MGMDISDLQGRIAIRSDACNRSAHPASNQ
jgi:hypothetical protein